MAYFDRYHRYSSISFPHTDRVYFDWRAYEFQDESKNQKLLDIAYMLTNGYDVRSYIHNTYKSREHVSEDNVRSSILILMTALLDTHSCDIKYQYEHKNLNAVIDDFFSILLNIIMFHKINNVLTI